MATGVGEFLWVIVPSIIIAVFMYAFFAWAREQFPSLYEYRVLTELAVPETNSESLPKGVTAWIYPLLTLPLSKVAHTAGLDAAAYIVFQALALSVLGASSVVIMFTLLPVYLTGGNGLKGFDSMSLSNVAQDSWRLWPCAFMLWIGSGLWYTAFYKGVSIVASIKERRERAVYSLQDHVVLVQCIPHGNRTVEAVREYFAKRWPGEVLHVDLVRDLSAYDRLVTMYIEAWRGLKRAEAILATRSLPPLAATWPACFPLIAKVKAVPHYSEQVQRLRAEIEEGRKNCGAFLATSSAFVTFRSLASAAEAKATLRSRSWHCRYAPEPRDILWRNMCKGLSAGVRHGKSAFFALAVLFVVVCFCIPVAVTQSFVNLEALSHKNHWLSWSLQQIPSEAQAFLQGLLPAVVLLGLQALVIPLIRLLAWGSGAEEVRTVHQRVMIGFFFFLMFNSFLVVICSGAVFNQLHMLRRQPDRITELLGVSLPKVGSFFILFITLRALSTAPGHIALATNFVISQARLFFSETEFEREEALDPGFPPYGPMYATDLFVFCVTVSYAVVSPLIMIFGALYFALNLITGKYLLCFVYRTEYQSGGAQMVVAVQLALSGLLLGQLASIAVLLLKESITWVICFPLPLVTLGFMLWLPHGVGKPLTRQDLTRDLATELDTCGADVSGLLRDIQSDQLFVHPSLSLDLDNPVQKPWEIKVVRHIILDEIGAGISDEARMGLAMNASIAGVDATIIGASRCTSA